jgi:hypothetical protein
MRVMLLLSNCADCTGMYPHPGIDVDYKVGAAAVLISICLSGTCAPQTLYSETGPVEYVARRGGSLIPAGQTEIDGRRMTCGTSPTVLDSSIGDFGGAYKSFIVLNPALFAGLATSVKLWIFSHECAHQTVGLNEVRADCVAVQRGHREGWLTADGLAQVCEFMKPSHADSTHFAGTQRCELMRQCFQETKTQPTH